jgi:hypothetical protein
MPAPEIGQPLGSALIAGTGEGLRTAGRHGTAPSVSRPADQLTAGRGPARSWAWPAGFTVAGVVLFLCYLRLSRTTAVTADGASNALQAWDMLHGNLLLHGWTVSDVPFYTTELPEYMAVEFARSLSADVVHVSAAISYTLVVLLAALLAKGKATGRPALARMLVAGGIMLAPELGGRGVNILLLSPDHIGTEVPLLVIWLVIDRARRRWWVPVVAGLALAVVQVADRIAVTVAVAPLVVACGVRACRAVWQRSEPLRSQWFELSLGAAAIISVKAAAVAGTLITDNGGYTAQPLKTAFASAGDMPAHFWMTLEGIFGLYGANFFGQALGPDAAFAVLHLAGVALAGWALWLAIRHFFRQDLAAAVLALAIVFNLVTFVPSVLPGTYWATREISAVLPLGAVLAGRLLAGRLIRARLAPAMAAILLCYALALGYGMTKPLAPAYGQDLAGWLAGRHLTSGLADYPEANTTTLDSGGRVQVRYISWPGSHAAPGNYESDASWYDPRSHYANFVVALSEPHGGTSLLYDDARAAFGRPARTYRFRRFIIMTWHKNLLADLR